MSSVFFLVIQSRLGDCYFRIFCAKSIGIFERRYNNADRMVQRQFRRKKSIQRRKDGLKSKFCQ